MTILLDTHVVIWLGENSQRLGRQAREILAAPSNQLVVSYVSIWEIAIKAAVGKMVYDESIFEDMAAADIAIAYPTREALTAYRIHNQANKDPFDNMLLAVAETEHCAFMTSDAKILAGPADGITVINARA
jgi:PIN domain nuclease of toxin-antitoxin system